jgi:pyruvate dehydrogenase E2 component (dihydrolipoamide acetyltransferase)
MTDIQVTDRPRQNINKERGMGPVKLIPLTNMRKTIIKHLSNSEKNTLRVTMTMEVDMSTTVELRNRLIQREKRVRISYTDIIIKATTDALKHNILLNSRLEGDTIKIFETIHMAVAVALESGLIVPVIHDASDKSLVEIALVREELMNKARSGVLSLKDVTGGTFTITNLGSFGVDMFTPIINPPQSAILAIGRIAEKPIVMNGEIEARHMMLLSLSFDHRIIDGAEAAKFLQMIKGFLENSKTRAN